MLQKQLLVLQERVLLFQYLLQVPDLLAIQL
jgi:hypothetical protein